MCADTVSGTNGVNSNYTTCGIAISQIYSYNETYAWIQSQNTLFSFVSNLDHVSFYDDYQSGITFCREFCSDSCFFMQYGDYTMDGSDELTLFSLSSFDLRNRNYTFNGAGYELVNKRFANSVIFFYMKLWDV